MALTVVVGAGLAGLSAAWELVRAGLEVMVLESERRAGGVVVTERRDGFVIEGGPDGWLGAEPEIPTLAAELGIADRIVGQAARGAWRWTGHALERLEEGQAADLLGIQTRTADLSAGFRSFATGMATLVEGLLDRLGPVVRSPLGVTGLVADGARWRLAVTGGAMIGAEAVVLALPAYSAGRLLEQAGAGGARALAEVTYFPSTTVSLAYRAGQVGRALEGTGFVTAPEAPAAVRACTFASRKFPGRAPDDGVLLRAFVAPSSGDRDEAAVAHDELRAMLELRGEPLWSRTFTWAKGIPRYGAGHEQRVRDARRRLERLNPLAIAGAGYDGAGVSACVRSGRQAGREIASRLASSTIRSTVSPNS